MLADVVRRQPDEWGAQQVRLWAMLVAGKAAELPDAMRALSKQVALRSATPPSQDVVDALEATARYLGSVLGYLEGPKGILRENEASDLAQKLLDELGYDYAGQFEIGRKEVAERFAQLRHEEGVLAAEVQSKLGRKADKERKKLAEASSEAAQQDQIMQTASESLKKDMSELATMDEQLATLREQHRMLDDQALGLQVKSGMISAQNASTTTDPLTAAASQLSARDLSNQINVVLMQIGNQRNQVDARILVLEGRRKALLSRDDIEGRKLAKYVATRSAQKKQFRAQQKKLDHDKSNENAPELKALRTEIVNLENYLQNPLDDEEQRVLRLHKDP